MRNCNVCDTELVLHENWWPSHFRNGNYICNKCHYEYKKSKHVVFKNKQYL